MFYNFFTKEEYTGKNVEILKQSGYTGGFLTFNQARKMRASVRKGEKCVAKLIRYVDDQYNKKKETWENGFRTYAIFHISQVDFKEEQNDS